ncbi:MAG: hypothetical protein ACOZJX_05285 [Pseudomonadota bacterium]
MHQDVPVLLGSLGSRLADAISWIASAISMAAALGFVNLTVGVLSAGWLATQIFRFWRYEVHALRRARQQAAAVPVPVPLPTARPTCPTHEDQP